MHGPPLFLRGRILSFRGEARRWLFDLQPAYVTFDRASSSATWTCVNRLRVVLSDSSVFRELRNTRSRQAMPQLPPSPPPPSPPSSPPRPAGPADDEEEGDGFDKPETVRSNPPPAAKRPRHASQDCEDSDEDDGFGEDFPQDVPPCPGIPGQRPGPAQAGPGDLDDDEMLGSDDDDDVVREMLGHVPTGTDVPRLIAQFTNTSGKSPRHRESFRFDVRCGLLTSGTTRTFPTGRLEMDFTTAEIFEKRVRSAYRIAEV